MSLLIDEKLLVKNLPKIADFKNKELENLTK